MVFNGQRIEVEPGDDDEAIREILKESEEAAKITKGNFAENPTKW